MYPILHNILIPISDATVRLGKMCPSNTYGNPGIFRSHTCVDFSTVPSGKLILSVFFAGCTFFVGVFFTTITNVAPVSATVCVMGIVGFLGCELWAHMCCCCVNRLSVTTVILSLSMLMFCVGYKAWFETNELKHFTHTITYLATDSYASPWYTHHTPLQWTGFFRSKPSWWLARLQGAGHVFDICPSSTSNLHEKHTFQFLYCLKIFEYIGAALCVMFCCVNGGTPPLRPPPPLIGGRPPCLPRPTNFVNGVRALRPPMLAKFAQPPLPLPPRLPPPRPDVLNVVTLGIENYVMGGNPVCTGW